MSMSVNPEVVRIKWLNQMFFGPGAFIIWQQLEFINLCEK